MAALLLVVVDQVNPHSVYLDTKRYKRGDVVDVWPDDHVFGVLEQTLPLFRIVIIPAVSVSEATAYLSPELPVDPNNPSKTLLRRWFKLDVDHALIPAALAAYLADATRTVPSFTATLPITTARLLTIKKASVPDPAVI